MGEDRPGAIIGRERRWEERLKWPVVVAAALAVPAVVLGVSRVPPPWPIVAEVLHWSIWLVFASEVVIMLAVTTDRRAWLRRNRLALVVVLISSPLLPALGLAARALGGPGSLKLLGLLKLTKAAKGAKAGKLTKLGKLGKLAPAKRLLRLGRFWRVVRVLRRGLRLRGLALGLLVAALALMVLGSLTIVVEGERYRSPLHGAWHLVTAVAARAAEISPVGWTALVLAALGVILAMGWSERLER